MPKLNPKLVTVRVAIRAKSGEKLEEIKASIAVIRQGWIRRLPIKTVKDADFFFLQMEPSRYPLFVSATDFYEKAQVVDFVKGVNPLIEVVLEPVHNAIFRSFEELSDGTRQILNKSSKRLGEKSGRELYEGLERGKKAAALNILAKMGTTMVSRAGGPPIVEAVDHIYEFRRDRIYAAFTRNVQTDIERSLRDQLSRFERASGALHEDFPSGSYKTEEKDKLGNLQLTFDTRDKKRIKADADIDIYTDVFRHFFGEVFVNNLTDMKTNPFQVYGILVKDNTIPEYSLIP